MSHAKKIYFDGLVLKRRLRENGMSARFASQGMGYGASYVSNCINENCMTAAGANLLKLTYGIDIKDMPLKNNDDGEKRADATQLQVYKLSYKRLEDAIYNAIIRAVKEGGKP